MMLEPIYLGMSMEDKLDVILEYYNKEHPDDQLSYQKMAEQLLEDAIYLEYNSVLRKKKGAENGK